MEPELKDLMASIDAYRNHGGCELGTACDHDAVDANLLALIERDEAAFAVRLLEGAACHCRRDRHIHEALSDEGDPPFDAFCSTCHSLNRWRKVREAK